MGNLQNKKNLTDRRNTDFPLFLSIIIINKQYFYNILHIHIENIIIIIYSPNLINFYNKNNNKPKSDEKFNNIIAILLYNALQKIYFKKKSSASRKNTNKAVGETVCFEQFLTKTKK